MTARTSFVQMGDTELVIVSKPLIPVDSCLTPSELEVARLIAAGRSNAEVAAARGRSERTIANQVASILRKLGISSRHQIAHLVGDPSGGG